MKLCVALDLASAGENLQLAEQLCGEEVWFKVGLRSFIRDGWSFLEDLARAGGDKPVFLDLKLHDIPKTMADAAETIADRGVAMFNLHASAGPSGLQTVMERLSKRQKRPLVLGVTALTSLTEQEFETVYHAPLEKSAAAMARSSFEAGLDGVVCSVHEVGAIKSATEPGFLALTPGIRLPHNGDDDQNRIASPLEAHEAGSDFIVMGRPIYGAQDPAAIVRQVLGSL